MMNDALLIFTYFIVGFAGLLVGVSIAGIYFAYRVLVKLENALKNIKINVDER